MAKTENDEKGTLYKTRYKGYDIHKQGHNDYSDETI